MRSSPVKITKVPDTVMETARQLAGTTRFIVLKPDGTALILNNLHQVLKAKKGGR